MTLAGDTHGTGGAFAAAAVFLKRGSGGAGAPYFSRRSLARSRYCGCPATSAAPPPLLAPARDLRNSSRFFCGRAALVTVRHETILSTQAHTICAEVQHSKFRLKRRGKHLVKVGHLLVFLEDVLGAELSFTEQTGELRVVDQLVLVQPLIVVSVRVLAVRRH